MKMPVLAAVLTLPMATPASVLAQVPLEAPAGVVWSGPSKSWFVSNSGRASEGGPSGWIARVDAGDRKAEPFWLRGFESPGGMAILGDRLYVPDGRDVAIVNIAGRMVEKKVSVPGALRLHAVAVDTEGVVYASDPPANAIYRLPPDGAPELFLKADRLEAPMGLAVQGSDLVVASSAGRLLRVNLRSKAITAITGTPIGNLDGLGLSHDAYLVTDPVAGTLLCVSATGTSAVVRAGLRAPAAIASRPEGVAAVAERDGNAVVFLTPSCGEPPPAPASGR
jgi:hypothetical protein